MKKPLLLLVMVIGINTAVFSLTESWLSIGFEYGNFWESSSDGRDYVKGYIGSPGISLSAYSFWNGKNVGIFVHDIFAFPSKMTAEINGVKTKVDLSVYDFMMQLGMVIGPGFRVHISDNFKLHFGVGFSFLLNYATYTRSTYLYNNVSFSLFAVNIGIGGDIGAKYDFTDIFYLNIGSVVTFDFVNYTSTGSSFSSVSAWAKNYFMFGLRPYICIGFNFYRDSDNLGKPKS